MNKEVLNKMYLDWLLDFVCTKEELNDYHFLMEFLHSKEFIWTINMDENRAADGIEMRGRFAEELGFNYISIRRDLSGPCSMLEMMVGLAVRCEEGIMGDGLEDQTGRWFWYMIHSLGLIGQKNKWFDEQKCEKVYENFVSKNYNRDGKGGLFAIKSGTSDMREVEIWYQLMAFLNEIS